MQKSIVRIGATVAAGVLASTVFVGAAPAAVAAVDTSRCDNTTPPTWFYPHLQNAADVPGDGVPSSWGDSYNMAKIVCWESSYNQDAYNDTGELPVYGLAQLQRRNIDAANVSFNCYWYGGCNKDRRYHQLLAALRYANTRYGSPAGGWQHIKDHGWW